MRIPNQSAVDWSAVRDAVSDAIADGEGSPGAKDLERVFKAAGILVVFEDDIVKTMMIEVDREVLHQLARAVAGPRRESLSLSTLLAVNAAAAKIVEATALGGDVHIAAK